MVYSVTGYGKTGKNARIFNGITSSVKIALLEFQEGMDCDRGYTFTCCWDKSSRARAQMVSLRCAMSTFVGL